MTKPTALLCAITLFAYNACTEAPEPEEDANPTVSRIGTYDSRAIAVAFLGSEVYQATAGKKLADKMAEYRKAEAEGDTKRVEELKAWGDTQQELLHKQGFSTEPVDDILATISNFLPEIKKEADVEFLVSKWDAITLANYKTAEKIDVTMRLVDAFKPNEKQKKSAIEIQKQDPVPLEK